MPRRHVAPGKLRRRLTVAFVLVAGISAGALAAGSFYLVRATRLRDSLDRGRAEALRDLRPARRFPAPLDVAGLLKGIEDSGAHAVFLAREGGTSQASTPSIRPVIPASIQAIVAQGDLAYVRVTVPLEPGEARHYLMIGAPGPPASPGGQLYFLFSEDPLARDLAQLRNVLLAGWLLVVAVAALVGRSLARRTLEPVGRASQAARDMAEGLLETRLPVETEDEFGRWAASFNEMAAALQAKITALSEAQARERRFTSDVSHELRTPLAALVGEASLLGEHLDAMPADARRPAELLIQDVGRLRRLVEELMEISRFDAGRESVVPRMVQVRPLLDAVIRARGWVGQVSVAGDTVSLSTDGRRLERILGNLVGNALEHGGAPVEVRIVPDPVHDGTGATIEVADHGPGITPEHLPHLFERFYKADPSRSGPGSGLGLAIAMENARLLGGDIEVTSRPGLGTRFIVRLPSAEEGAEDDSATQPLRTGEWDVSPSAEPDAHIPAPGGGTT
jgi:two-component system sensor histidine kinase MtrB